MVYTFQATTFFQIRCISYFIHFWIFYIVLLSVVFLRQPVSFLDAMWTLKLGWLPMEERREWHVLKVAHKMMIFNSFTVANDYNFRARWPKWIEIREWITIQVNNYSSQKDKALPVKTSKPNFVTFFMYFGNSLLD